MLQVTQCNIITYIFLYVHTYIIYEYGYDTIFQTCHVIKIDEPYHMSKNMTPILKMPSIKKFNMIYEFILIYKHSI